MIKGRYYIPGKGMSSSRVTRGFLRQRDGEKCWLCGFYVAENLSHESPWHASIDHVIELSRGGENHTANLRLAHAYCNNLRSIPYLMSDNNS